jgi:hypothetical protein
MFSLFNSARPHAKSSCLVVSVELLDEMASPSKETKVKKENKDEMDFQDETALFQVSKETRAIVERLVSCLS